MILSYNGAVPFFSSDIENAKCTAKFFRDVTLLQGFKYAFNADKLQK